MIHVKNSTQYYINERALTFSENDLDNANRVAVSLISGTVILVHVPGTIDYASDGNYERWSLKGYSTRLVNAAAHYVYARLSRTDRTALIVFSVKNYNIDGSITTVTGTDENGNDITETTDPSADYFFIRIGEITATDSADTPTVNRELTYDSGLLSTDKGNSMTDPNDMWELDQYSTPWLIRAKHWLTSFTLKGFITLIGGLIFKNAKGEEKQIVDVMRSTDSGDPNDANYVPIDDTTIPTTAWIQNRSDDRYLKKYEPDETHYRIKFFDGIEAGYFVKGMIGGSGTQFDGDGYGEMNGLTLREFLEVPELRFNRIDVVSGELWNSVAFGLIEKVDTAQCKAWVKLEERERCGLHVYDICRGIFADFGDGTQWEGVDECGFLHLYGFWTSYFTPTEIIESGEGVFCFRYELKAGTTQHPTQSMKFAVYGNFVDSSRQASAYSTRTYKRYLNKVDTWVIDPDKHIYAQYGELNGLTIGGQEMTGYGSFQSNSYFTGVQIQFTPQQKLELQGESAYSVTLSDYEGIVTIDDEGNIIGGETELLNVITDGENVITDGQNVVTAGYKLQTQVQAMLGSTPLYYSPASPSEGAYTIAINSVGCTAMILNGVVVVTSVFYTERCYVTIIVNCEGKASFTQTYHITAVRDGKNPIMADIDNEMDSVACDSAGKVLFGLPVSCTVSMWAGTQNLSLDSLSITNLSDYVDENNNPTVTASADHTTGIVKVTAIADSAPRAIPLNITAYASYGGTQYHKDLVFTVNKVNAGENALLYKLSPSASSVKVDDAGNMTATSIKCEVVSSDGSTIQTLGKLPSGVTMQYYRDDEATKDYSYNSAVSVNSGTKTVTFKLYAGDNLIDVETIPILLDGSSPLIVDLDNEMQSVACDEYGTVVLGLPLSTGVKAFYGSKELEVKEENITLGTVSGVTASVSGTTVKVTAITKDAVENIRLPITVKASHDKEYTRTVYLIVNKLKQGEAAAVVDLVPSVSVIKINSENVCTPTSVSCSVKVTTGKQGTNVPAACPENYTMEYDFDGGTKKSYTSDYGQEIDLLDGKATKAKTAVTFYLYYKGTLVDKETVPVVNDATEYIKSTVFRRINGTPDTPAGGSFADPEPDGDLWSDGIPSGEAILWASVCTFCSDGSSTGWSTPAQMTDTASFDVEFSSYESPSAPSGHPNTNSQWSNTASSDTIWMATCTKSNGVWSDWQVSKIKGEKGDKMTFDDLTGEEKDSLKAKYYTIEASAGSISYTMTGSYSPEAFIVSEYSVLGNSKKPSNVNYIHFYGLKDGKEPVWLDYTSQVDLYKFDASKYVSYNFDSFRFDLRTGSSSSSAMVSEGAYTTVPVAKHGATGVMPRYCGVWNSDTTYYYNSQYRDIVVYEGKVFQVWAYGEDGVKSTPDTTMSENGHDDYWQMASIQKFVAMDTALIDSANIAGFTFTRLNSDLSNPVGKLASQNGTLELNAYDGSLTCNNVNLTGTINADAGYIGEFFIDNGILAAYSSNNQKTMALSNGGVRFTDTMGVQSNYVDIMLGTSSYYLNTGYWYPALTVKNSHLSGMGIVINAKRALQIEKGFSAGIRHVSRDLSSSDTLTIYDHFVYCYSTLTITFPSGCEDGQEYWIYPVNGNSITVKATGSDKLSVNLTHTGKHFHVYVYHSGTWYFSQLQPS